MDFMPLPFVEVFRRKSGFDYESTAVLDIWKSMSVKENFKSANTFETVVLLKYMPKELMDEDTVLLINNCFYYIDSIICDDLSSGLITISGKSLFAKSGKRIVYRIYNQTKRPELICYDHLRNEVVSPSDAKRKISYLSVEQPPAITNSNISYQNSYGNVEEEIEDCVKVTILVLTKFLSRMGVLVQHQTAKLEQIFVLEKVKMFLV